MTVGDDVVAGVEGAESLQRHIDWREGGMVAETALHSLTGGGDPTPSPAGLEPCSLSSAARLGPRDDRI